MTGHPIICRVTGSVLLLLCGFGSARGDDPPTDDRSLAYWIQQLDSDSFLRRQAATQRVLGYGAEAVEPLVEVTSTGRLEMTERSIAVLQTLALQQLPDDQAGAWAALESLVKQGSGSASLRARASIAAISRQRQNEAYEVLARVGVKIGFREFTLRSTSINRNAVLIDKGWNGDLAALRWLRWVGIVDHALIEGPAVRGEVLEQVARMPDVRVILLRDGQVSGDLFTPLASMKRIEELEFRYIALSAEDAERIAKLPIRASLSLMGTGIPHAVAEQLREAMPGLNINHKQGGFLGVRCSNHAPFCQIDSLVPGGAADTAGLEAGDVVTRINDTTIRNFDDLQLEIGNFVPGDEIDVTFDRRGEVLETKLTLGRMPSE